MTQKLPAALLLLLVIAASRCRCAEPAASSQQQQQRTVLVLGSGGVVGTALVAELQARGHTVLEVRNRLQVDLRVNNSLSVFDGEAIDFCFFVACEVGGAKFLASGGSVQEAVWEYNVMIYDNVLPYLRRRRVPYIFTSSQLADQPSGRPAAARCCWVALLPRSRSPAACRQPPKPLRSMLRACNV